MNAVYVPDELTQLTFDDVVSIFAWAIEPHDSDAALALVLAKTALETGRWQKMHNWNFGNAKAGSTYTGMYTAFPCNEVLGGRVVWFAPEGELDRKGGKVVGKRWDVPPAHPQTRFRAFASRYDGANEYVRLMRERFPHSYQWMLSGDAESFVLSLKRERYFTADEQEYLRAVASLQREFMQRLAGYNPEPVSLEDETLERLRMLVAVHQFDTHELLYGADDERPNA